jgi:(S)-2-hydroxyglutarate dehydrogenase
MPSTPSPKLAFQVAVIGAGIVGLATAAALLDAGWGPVVVLEAEQALAGHQTGRNSGVIHSGIYYKPGSLKARLCAEGRHLLETFCTEHGVPFERCGKLIIATDQAQLPALDELHRRAAANGLEGVRRLAADQIKDHEPHAAGIAALWVPQTGIVSFRRVAEALARSLPQRAGGGGAEVRMSSRVLGVHREGAGFILQTTAGEVRARNLVNCAGLHSDHIARLCGLEPRLRIIPFRGEYYLLKPERQHLVRNLIYPVPDPRFPFLGVHFTRRIDGTVEAGPNAVLALARHGYGWRHLSARDTAAMLAFPGFWRMAARHCRTGIAEVRRSLSPARFARDLAALVPEIRPQDLSRARAGVRAQAVDVTGKLIDDFALLEAPGMLHVLNAPSPAATASFAIGRELCARAQRVFTNPSSGTVATHVRADTCAAAS